jgi:hypothetical protein
VFGNEAIEFKSDVARANGEWRVATLEHQLGSENPFSTITWDKLGCLPGVTRPLASLSLA